MTCSCPVDTDFCGRVVEHDGTETQCFPRFPLLHKSIDVIKDHQDSRVLSVSFVICIVLLLACDFIYFLIICPMSLTREMLCLLLEIHATSGAEPTSYISHSAMLLTVWFTDSRKEIKKQARDLQSAHFLKRQ